MNAAAFDKPFNRRPAMTRTVTDYDITSRLPRAPEKRTTQQLHERLANTGLQVTQRSLQRRLEHLASIGAGILCDKRSKPYGWSIAATSKIGRGELSVQEAMALKLAERYLREALPADMLDDLKHYFVNANAKLKADSLYGTWQNKIRVVPTHQALVAPTVAPNIRTRAYESVLKGRVVSLTYANPYAGTTKTHTLHPRAIVLRGNVSYLIAANPKFAAPNNIAWFALHRTQKIQVTEEIFPQENFDLDAHIASTNMGGATEQEATLRVRFYDDAGVNLEEAKLTKTQKLTKTGEHEHILVARIPITAQLQWWLMGFGARAEVLAPAWLRREFAERMRVGAARYGGKDKARRL